MKMAEDIIPVTDLKNRTADLLEQINNTHRPVIITQNGRARAVIQDPKSYEDMRDTIAMLLLIAQGERDVRDGRVVEAEAFFEKLEMKLARGNKARGA